MRRLLILPLAGFLLVFFVVPLGWLLSLAVRDAEVPRALPRTLVALQGWQTPQPLPAPLWPAPSRKTWSKHAPPARWPTRRGG
jgi:endonuclease/exonuclease/phosphatase (EEP) superfamily protein YafD